MKARILILTVIGSVVFAAAPAFAAGNGAQPVRQLQFAILPDGGSTMASPRRAPTAITHRVAKAPWEAPNHSQVEKNSF